MRMHGVVRGSSIALRELSSLADRQAGEVKIVTTESPDPSVGPLRAFRARLLERWREPMDLSTQMIEQDRSR